MDNLYEIYVGDKTNPTFYFDNEDIVDLSSETAVNMIMEELSIDTLTFTVRYEYIEQKIFKPTNYDAFESSDSLVLCTYGNSDITGIEWGTPVWFFNNSIQISKFYVNTVKRTDRYEYVFECVSFIGLLDKQTFYGGAYTGNYFTYFPYLARQIIAGNGLANYIGYDYIQVYGTNTTSVNYQSMPVSRYKLQMEFTYEGICEGLAGTSDLFCVCGFKNEQTSGQNYGIFCTVTRASTTDEWSTPRLDLYYGSQVIQGINLIVGETYEIEVDPSTGKYTINDTELTFTAETFTPSTTYFYICGLGFIYSTGTISHFNGGWKGKLLEAKLIDTAGESASYDWIIGRAIDRNCSALINIFSSSGYEYANASYFTKSSGSTSTALGNVISVDNANFLTPSDTELEILNTIQFDTQISSIKVYGWLPICTKREALQQLMFAYSVNLIKDENGDLIFTWIYDTDTMGEISDSQIFNEGEVSYEDVASKAEITEHTYVYDSTATKVDVFDNTSGSTADNLLIQYPSTPLYGYSPSVTGTLVVNVRGANCAVVSGVGTLKLVPYTHNTNTVVKTSGLYASGTTVSVSDVTLITAQNSESIAERVFNYYSTKQIAKNAIVYSSQNCGRKFSFHNKFMETMTGYLHKISITASNILKATCEYVTNYTPKGMGGYYSNSVLLTGDGTWTVPASVLAKSTPRIKVVLVGGGHGGSSGLAGANGNAGSTTYWDTNLESGEGGDAGSVGEGGKIYQFTIEGSAVASSYQYSCGDGGAGGSVCSSHTTANEGSDGGDTTFGSYSSASGVANNSGVTNMLNGATYAKSPNNLGLDSSQTEDFRYSSRGQSGGGVNNSSYYTPQPPMFILDYGHYRLAVQNGTDSTTAWNNNKFNNSYTPNEDRVKFDVGSWWAEIDGGFAGGSAAGNTGASGTAPSWKSYPSQVQLGSGGNGADAIAPITIDEYAKLNYGSLATYGYLYYPYGYGGLGGNGGGGGGSSGSGNSYCQATCYAGTVGTGGKGSAGGKGAKGCIIVYY